MRIRSRGAVAAALAGGIAMAAVASGGEATYVGSYTWTNGSDRFGGLSGLEISADGSHLTAVGDRSILVTAEITRSNGRIVSVAGTAISTLESPYGYQGAGDSEGLAVLDGQNHVSFEGPSRVWIHDGQGAFVGERSRSPDFRTLQHNSGLEALAVDGKGRMLTLPERSGELTRPFPVWRQEGDRWTQPYEIPRRGGFLAVGADVGPDGRFYLLEREFTGFAFRSRVRRFDMTEDALSGETELLRSSVFQHDNLEGLAVWRDDKGEIRLTMISDDNFNALQKTQLVEYRVPETLDFQDKRP
ncbi:cobalamin/Fe3+-siderophores ABC transporter ATPase [Salipiger aestuarii]|nr:cobalamin/Fe3+-siderophores ABC transporter ATPase [Salipiger aestuarii]